ncbi:MAG: hypothetical protein AAF519_11580 [Bacteroidota bacterium]
MRKSLCLVALSALSLAGYSQAGLVKRALNQLSEREYSKVEETISKIQKKDTSYAGLYYTKAQLYIDDRFNQFHIDSAHFFFRKGKQLTERTEAKDIAKLAKAGMDSLAIMHLSDLIDSAAFDRAQAQNTEDGYIFFLKNYPATIYQEKAIRLRDARAFENASERGTYQAYQDFMEAYPESAQFREAEKRYERLYFEKSTADGKLSSFKKFLQKHPTTPYREELEWRIFQVMTADHLVQSYKAFVRRYPSSKFAPMAEQFGYHVAKENGLPFTSLYFADSLSRLDQYPAELLFYLQGRKYGLMSTEGEVITPAQYTNLDRYYVCDGLDQDVFLAGKSLYSLNGAKIAADVESFQDLGAGLIKVKRRHGFQLFHKSGHLLQKESYEDIELLLGQFLALKSRGKWDLVTVSGIRLTSSKVDDINAPGKFVLLEKQGRWDVKVAQQLTESADNQKMNLQFIFDDYELLENDAIWLKSASGEVVLDPQLNELIPYKKQEIGFLPFGYSVKTQNGFQLFSTSFEIISEQTSGNITHNQNYIVLESDSLSTLIGTKHYAEIAQFDSIELFGSQFALGYSPDTVIIYGPDTAKLTVPLPAEFELIKSTGSKEFILLKANDDTFIVDEQIATIKVNGYKAFAATGRFVVVEKDGKKGVIANNERVLSAKYDAIVQQNDGLTLLRDGKFGLHSSRYGFTVAPHYDRRINGYGELLFTGVKKGIYTFIDSAGKELSRLNNAESVEYWQDSLALVKTDGVWKFYDIYQDQWQDQTIKSFTDINSKVGERRIIALGAEGYGVVSSTYGEVIPLSFNDIVSLGPPENPVYFTEKHIAEAEFYVVIYYDHQGQIIRKQAFEASDYDLIYCDR